MNEYEALKKTLDDAEEQARIDALIEEAISSTESKSERYRVAAIARNSKPDIKARHKEGILRAYQRPDYATKKAQANRDRAKTEEFRRQHRSCVMIRAKIVMCIDAGTLYESSADAARGIGVKHSGHISSACLGTRRIAYGYHWRYATPEEVAYFWAERERTGTDGPFKLPSTDVDRV